MARYRFAALILGLVAGLAICWYLGLGNLLMASRSMADDLVSPDQPTDVADSESGALALSTATAPTATPIPTGVVTSQTYDGTSYYRYIPTTADPSRPMTVLVTIRGMGDRAEDFASSFAPLAEANGWMLIVPRFNYGDWKQTETLKTEDRANSAWLSSLLNALPEQIPFPIRSRILVYGFSRGAQAAHRFALMYPEQVLAVASMSAGTYTLPVAKAAPAGKAPLDFPLGVADLERYCGEPFDASAVRRVAFWVGVGEKDNAPSDVPQSWDQYIGNTRVERAKSFTRALSDLGAAVQLEIIPGLGHGESAQSRSKALAFLKAEGQKADAATAAPATDPGTPQPGG